MNDPKPKGKRLAEFAETDAILRLISGVQKPKPGKKKQQAKEESNPPPLPDSTLTPPSEAFVGDDTGRPTEPDVPPIAEVAIEAEASVVDIIEEHSPAPPESVVASPAAQFEPERLSTAMPMHAFVESYGAPALTDFESAFRDQGSSDHPDRVAEPDQPDSAPQPSVVPADPVPLPIGALSFGDLLARINWKNRPADVQPLPLIGEPDPPGYAESVQGVLAAFKWDDE